MGRAARSDTAARASLQHAPDWVFDAAGVQGESGIAGSLSVAGSSRAAEHAVMVYGCLVARTSAIGGVAVKLTDEAENPVDRGAAALLLAKPNQGMVWSQYIRVLETYLTLYDALAIALVDVDGEAPELVPLSPAFIQPVMGVHVPTGTPVATAYDYSDPSTGMQKRYLPEQLIIHNGFNPYAPLAALSPLTVLTRTIKGELAAREQNLALFQNGSTPKGVLATDRPMTKEQADEVRSKWEDTHRGQERAHKTAVLWGGLKYQQLGLSPVEMDYLAGLKFLRTDYYMVFRVCPAMVHDMVGETGLSQGSSTDEQKAAWWEDVGLAELKLIQDLHAPIFEAVSRRRDGQPLSMWFDDNTIPALARHRLAKIEQFTKLVDKGYRPDDVNEFLALGLPAHPDNEGRVPFNLQVVGEERATHGSTVPPPAAPAEPASRVDLPALFDQILEAASRADSEKRRAAEQADSRIIATLEKDAAKKWSRFFIEQRGRVLKRLSTVARTDAVARAVGSDAANLVFSAFPRAEEDMALVARISPVVVNTLQTGWDQFNSRFDIKNPFEVENPAIQAAIERRMIQCKKVNDTTEEDLRKIFSDGFTEGLSVDQLGDKVAEYYSANAEGYDSARAQTAAATQTTGIVNDAELIAARDAGGLKKFWIAVDDAVTRPAHAAAAEGYGRDHAIGLDEKFVVDGEQMDSPGDSAGSAGNVCNCRCQLGFVRADVARSDSALFLVSRFDPGQPRDSTGRWTDTGDGGMKWSTPKGSTVELKGDRLFGPGPLAGGVKASDPASVHPQNADELKKKGLNPSDYVQLGGKNGPLFHKSDSDRLNEASKRAKTPKASDLATDRERLLGAVTNTYSPDNFPGSKGYHAYISAKKALETFDASHPEIFKAIREKHQQADKRLLEGKDVLGM